MKASTALLSALVPLATASAVFRNNADVLRSAESILHGLNTNHYYDQGLHTTEDGLKTIAQVILHNEVHGNITYEDGVLWARKDVEPTIWNLNQDCRRDSKGFQISAFDPFDRSIYWKTNYDKVTLGDNEYYDGSSRFLIRVANGHKGDNKNNGQASMADIDECEGDGKKPGHLPPGGEGDDEWQVMYIATSNSGCVYFNDEGMSRVGTVTACHPFKFKQVHDSDVPVWEDPNAHCPSV